jgi:WD40 repeat protein
MSGMRLKDADLTEGILRNSDLRGANLDGSILTRADFSGSDLEDADLRNTFVKDTLFQKTNLRGVSFRNIRMIGGPNRIWKSSFTANYQHIVTGTDRGNLLIQPFIVRSGSAVRDDSLKIIPVDSSGVLYFTFSHDGKHLAVSDRGSNVYLYHWERVLAGDTKPHKQYPGGDDYVRWLDFSPDGTCLASGGRDHAVKIWSVTGHSMAQTLSFHTGPVMYVLWSPDGRYLASTGYDANICLWSIQHDDVQRIVLADGNSKAHTGIIRSLAFNSQGTLLASGSEDHCIKIWNVPDQSSYPTLANQVNVADDVFCIQFIEHDRAILFGCSSGIVRRMDAETLRVTHTTEAHTDIIRSFSLYQEAGYLLTASWDGTIKLWNLADLSFVDEVYRLNQIDVQYGRTDAFAGACIQDIRDVSDIFRQYLSKLGATSDCEV